MSFPLRTSLLAAALAASLSACNAPAPPAQPEATSPPATDTAPPATPEPPPAPAVPALRALDDAQRAEVLVAATAGTCNLESVDGQAFAGADVTLSVPNAGKATGWLKGEGGVAPESPVLRIESDDKSKVWDIAVTPDMARDDLGADGGTPGFQVEFDAGALPSGRYHLYLAYRSGGALHACDNGRHIQVL